MPPKVQRITGWVLTGLVGLFLIGASGVPKFFDFPGKNEMMEKMGIPLSLLPTIGVIEIAVSVLYLIPRTSFLGAILVTGYLGGAVFTHLRVGDPWYFPIIVGVLAWGGLALRQPLIFTLARDGRFCESSIVTLKRSCSWAPCMTGTTCRRCWLPAGRRSTSPKDRPVAGWRTKGACRPPRTPRWPNSLGTEADRKAGCDSASSRRRLAEDGRARSSARCRLPRSNGGRFL